MLIQRYLYTYWYLYLSPISRRSLQNLYLYYRVYTCSEVPVGITKITERILVLRNLFLYGSTRKYYLFKCPKRHTLVFISNLPYTYTGVPIGTTEFILVLRIFYLYYRVYTGISDLILALQSIYMHFGFYTCITELIHVFQILHVYYGTYTGLTELILVFQILYGYYRTYTCISDLIHVLQNLYLSYGTYTSLTEHILILRILFLCKGTRRYNKSELIIIVSHTRLDHSYADTYQV